MNQSLRGLQRALIVSAVAVLAVACNTTTTPTTPPTTPPASPPASAPTAPPPASTSPTAAGTASPASGGAACAPADLALVSGGWSAAAGSRGADVSVENRGATACTLPAGPAVAILDASGTQLLESPPTDAPGPSLEPGAVATFTVLFSNWCDEAAALPLHVALRDGNAAIPVPDLDLTTDDLPPCNGPGQPPALSANPWEPVSG
ncbi:MAG TPA: DUF4232 domain-containing protein [Candidatus Limnocylindrales bacterium]|nr:DUF4232 domain-containing protein [Candidatus Limnocylindrales bacterium]